MRIVPGARVPVQQQQVERKPAKKRETLTIATVNDDFTDRKSNLRDVNADVVMLQETKNSNLRKVRPDEKKYGVHQGRGEAKAGAAVVWKKNAATATNRGYALGVRPQGAAMLTRYISWTVLKVGDQKVRMVSVHRPPGRFSRLWADFDRNLATFVKRSKMPTIIGMDANQVNPRRLAHLTGLRWHAPKGLHPTSHKKPIDGFLATRGIKFENIRRLPRGTSDHHPVTAKITLPPAK
ncbi:MAG: endonuclease/exonuclease/phosphatase family protein [Archangium sp.]